MNARVSDAEEILSDIAFFDLVLRKTAINVVVRGSPDNPHSVENNCEILSAHNYRISQLERLGDGQYLIRATYVGGHNDA